MPWIKYLVFAAILTATTALTAQQLILDGRTIDLEPGSQVIVNSSGDVVITSDDGDLTCVANTDPPTVDLKVNGLDNVTIQSGNSVTVSWTHEFADSCTATGGAGTNWASTDVSVSPGQTTLPNVTSNTTLTLSCTNLFGTVNDSAAISIQGTSGFPPPADCPTTAPPPPGTTQEDPLEIVGGVSGRIQVDNHFEGVFGEKWPGVTNSKEDVYVGTNNYVALGFRTDDNCTGTGCTRTAGRVEWELSIIGDGGKVVSISRCPGDFSTSLGNCRRTGTGPLVWSYTSNSVCRLDPASQYFLNVIHGTDADPSITTCSGSECGWLVNVR